MNRKVMVNFNEEIKLGRGTDKFLEILGNCKK
mgnify:CR=1 FL=1